ncbi:RNHCP domain-containing protein [Nocardiopsis alba]|uniref:RNHCP domain-containing protein n=2 Tax=Nocardiopsis alba TaxID=53437 RepID=A0ABV5DXL5_9ACTN|nr:RNHCP domain-containing protein [Nocardiopsis alba]AFR10111.1 RNHCP domain protein [Nocardiopsis alba ATCC BAA-2165]
MSNTDPTFGIADTSTFTCLRCGTSVSVLSPDGAERDHCPSCLTGRHVHERRSGGRSDCGGPMGPIAVVSDHDRWRLVHRCAHCDGLSEGDVASDDNRLVLMRIAVRPLAEPPFPLELLGEV